MSTQVPAQLPAVAMPTSYLHYLDAVQFLSLNAASNAERMCLTRPNFFAQLAGVCVQFS